jgi:hypothetical protein
LELLVSFRVFVGGGGVSIICQTAKVAASVPILVNLFSVAHNTNHE